MSVPAIWHDPEDVERYRQSALPHLAFLAPAVVVLLLLGTLTWIVKHHPGPLTGDVGIEVAIQHALLPHQIVAEPIEAVSTLNWPLPSAITLAVIFAIFLLLRRWLDAIVVPLAAGASSLATYDLSRWVHRPRPSGHGVHRLQVLTHTYSFPSGHVTYAVAIFGLFLFLTYQVRRPFHPVLVWAIRLALVVLIALMPISRILEGEHWPSDVLGGAFEDFFWLILFAHIYLWTKRRWPRLLAQDER